MAMSAPLRASRASATGPILPASVESKVEQYLKKTCGAPRARSASKAAVESATASWAGIERLLSATTSTLMSP
jgi:hypothetical protein